MKILVMTGPLYPEIGNNANLIGKVISCLSETDCEICLLSNASGYETDHLPDRCFGYPVFWMTDQASTLKKRFILPVLSKIFDPDGYSDFTIAHLVSEQLRKIRKEFAFDVVISTSEPYSMAAAASKLKSVKKVLYLMDPPNTVCDKQDTVYRKRTFHSILNKTDILVTTPFIAESLKRHQLLNGRQTVITAGFPMITDTIYKRSKRVDNKIRLLYCGWLYSDIRSPRYFLDIVSCLDERFEIVFMGRECEKLSNRFNVVTKARIITMPQQPYKTAMQAMYDADILINIGNSVPVHMPSKTLEYINTGKPIVNFYKFDNCPTLYYTKRYPLALNLYEGDADIKTAADRFTQFCLDNIGKTADRDKIIKEFKDCTARYIADKIKEVTGN